jgi:hypothetical protein
MKKIFFFAVLAVALAGFGMQAGTVHAQSMTATAAPVSNAQLEQELQVAKATLINLEMQQGIIPASDDQMTAGTGTTAQPISVAQPTVLGLSPTEVSYFNGVLSELTSSLAQLEGIIVANPNLNTTQLASISTTLDGMKGTLLAMSTQIAQDENSSNIAMTAPSTGIVAGASTTTPAQVAQTAPANTPATTPAAATSTNTVQATTQPSSVWSFTKANWPVIVIILLVIAILAILFWPESEAKTPVKTVSYPSAPSAPKAAAPATTGTGTNTTSASARSESVDPKTIRTA